MQPEPTLHNDGKPCTCGIPGLGVREDGQEFLFPADPFPPVDYAELIRNADFALAGSLPTNFHPGTHHKLGEPWADYGRKVNALRAEYGQEVDAETLYEVRRWAEMYGKEPRPFHVWPGNAEIMRDARAAYGPRLTDEAAYVRGQREHQALGAGYHPPMPMPHYYASYPVEADQSDPWGCPGCFKGCPSCLRSGPAEDLDGMLTEYSHPSKRPAESVADEVLQPFRDHLVWLQEKQLKGETTGWENMRLAWAYGPTRLLLVLCGLGLGFGTVQLVATVIGMVTS